jgi:hypothetical protein
MVFPCEVEWCETWSAYTPDRTNIFSNKLQVFAHCRSSLKLKFDKVNGSRSPSNLLNLCVLPIIQGSIRFFASSCKFGS